jgi:hypothetical protein
VVRCRDIGADDWHDILSRGGSSSAWQRKLRRVPAGQGDGVGVATLATRGGRRSLTPAYSLAEQHRARAAIQQCLRSLVSGQINSVVLSLYLYVADSTDGSSLATTLSDGTVGRAVCRTSSAVCGGCAAAASSIYRSQASVRGRGRAGAHLTRAAGPGVSFTRPRAAASAVEVESAQRARESERAASRGRERTACLRERLAEVKSAQRAKTSTEAECAASLYARSSKHIGGERAPRQCTRLAVRACRRPDKRIESDEEEKKSSSGVRAARWLLRTRRLRSSSLSLSLTLYL